MGRKNPGRAWLRLASAPLVVGAISFGAACQAQTPTARAIPVAAHGRNAHPDEPRLRSTSALVLDETNSSVLYSRHADVAAPIASITKLMTALVVADAKQPLDEQIEITTEDRSSRRGAASRLAPGTKLTRGDLIHLALMASENRAAHALARAYPGGIEAFVPAMNAKAKALGMTSAHFADPTGLSEDNVASPEDLSKLLVAASDSPEIREYSTDSEYAVRVGRRTVEFHNTNSLVSSPTWNIIVQKTGYTLAAGKCLVMRAIIEDRTILIVLLNSVGKYTRVADARRIRRWMESTLASAHGAASRA